MTHGWWFWIFWKQENIILISIWWMFNFWFRKWKFEHNMLLRPQYWEMFLASNHQINSQVMGKSSCNLAFSCWWTNACIVWYKVVTFIDWCNYSGKRLSVLYIFVESLHNNHYSQKILMCPTTAPVKNRTMLILSPVAHGISWDIGC